MNNKIVENPEHGKIYLVKKNKGGDPTKRMQPAYVFERYLDEFGTPKVKVKWVFDNVEEDILFYHGAIKQISKDWLNSENERVYTERSRLRLVDFHIHQLLFNPETQQQIG